MRIIDYLDALNWTQTRLSIEAKVSISTVQRLVQGKTINRLNADKICDTLTHALGYQVTLHDINELHRTRAERPERRKHKEEEEGPGQWLTGQQPVQQKSPGPQNEDQGDSG
jgi:transcriptional regulator with XRE-family HTH domain